MLEYSYSQHFDTCVPPDQTQTFLRTARSEFNSAKYTPIKIIHIPCISQYNFLLDEKYEWA